MVSREFVGSVSDRVSSHLMEGCVHLPTGSWSGSKQWLWLRSRGLLALAAPEGWQTWRVCLPPRFPESRSVQESTVQSASCAEREFSRGATCIVPAAHWRAASSKWPICNSHEDNIRGGRVGLLPSTHDYFLNLERSLSAHLPWSSQGQSHPTVPVLFLPPKKSILFLCCKGWITAVLCSSFSITVYWKTSDHATTFRRNFHWLLVPARIDYLMAILCYCCL